MKKLLFVALVCVVLSSCEKGLIFDKEMVIGDWRMWELYDPGHTFYWHFTADSVCIYKDDIGSPKSLVYRQARWNNQSYDIDLFENTNPFTDSLNLASHIEIQRYKRNYLVIEADHYNWSFTLSRIDESN